MTELQKKKVHMLSELGAKGINFAVFMHRNGQIAQIDSYGRVVWFERAKEQHDD